MKEDMTSILYGEEIVKSVGSRNNDGIIRTKERKMPLL